MPDSVTTTAKQIVQTKKPVSFIFEADDENTDNIRVSSKDPSVIQSYVSLPPGGFLSFEKWVGSIWIIAESGSQLFDIEFWMEEGQTLKG